MAVGLEEAANNDLALEVWDEGILGKGDFLGQVLVEGSDREGWGYLDDTRKGYSAWCWS